MTPDNLKSDLRDLISEIRASPRHGFNIFAKSMAITGHLDRYGISDDDGRYIEACLQNTAMLGKLHCVRDPKLLDMAEKALWRIVRWDNCICKRMTKDNKEVLCIGDLCKLPNDILQEIVVHVMN